MIMMDVTPLDGQYLPHVLAEECARSRFRAILPVWSHILPSTLSLLISSSLLMFDQANYFSLLVIQP